MEISHSALSSDGIDDDVSTRPDSSRLSLGSSPSELSDDEDPPHGSTLGDDDFALDDGDGSLTPTDKVDINDEDDIVLGGSSEALFSSDSSDTLSNASMDMDDRVDDEDDEEEQDERQDDDPPSPSKDQEKENTNEHIQDAKENGPVSGKKQGKKRRNSDETEQEEWDKRRVSKVLSKKEESLLAVAALENGDKNAGSIESPKTEQENGDEEGDDDEKDEAENDTPTLPTKEEEQNIAKAHEDDEDGSQEYERWHTEALEALTKIEVEFARLRDKMYQEKMAELNEEALMIAQGTHPELVAMMKTIEEKRNKRIKTAEAWRKYKQMNHQQQFEGLEYQANVDFIARKGALRRRIISSLSRKRWELDNEREKLNEPLSDADRVPDPNVLIPRKRQAGQESKELHRIQRSVGFPRAPGAEGLSLKTIEDDLNALGLARKPNDMDVEKSGNTSISNLARQGFNANTMNALPSNASGSVYTNQGLLFYHGQVFRKGDQFTIVDATAGRFSAKFLMATDTEVHIQRTDGSKTKLPLAQLARGKYQLFSKHS